MPTVSVLITVRDGMPYIPETLASIALQSFQDFEVVVIDDGSTDGTADAVRHASPRGLVLKSLSKSGIPAAANAGLALCRGRYTARIDGDDLMMPDRLFKQVAFLDENPAVAVVGSAIQEIRADGSPLGIVPYPLSPSSIAALAPACGIFAQPAVMFRTEAVREAGGYREQFALGEDCDLWLRLRENNDLANLAEPLTHYRRHDRQITSTQTILRQAAGALACALAERRASGLTDAPVMDGKSFAEACAAVAEGALVPNGVPAPALHGKMLRYLIQGAIHGAGKSPALALKATVLSRRLALDAVKRGDVKSAVRVWRGA